MDRSKREAWKANRRRSLTGSTPRVGACEHCHKRGRLQQHHPNYSEPNLVELLCRPCHRSADDLRRLQERAGLPQEPRSTAYGKDGSLVIPLDLLADKQALKALFL